jgi:large subunit ribosomal protein L32
LEIGNLIIWKLKNMGLPGHRRTSSDKRRRSAHFALKKSTINTCACGAAVLPHRACKVCGSYKGKKVVDITRAAKRAVKKTSKK